MTIKLSEARQICTKPELALVVSASPKELSGITLGRLEKKIERARKLRDKYAEQQKAQKTKGARSAVGVSAGTKRKVEIFGELLEKLVARKTLLEERKRKAQEAAAKKAAKAAKATAKKAAKKATAKKAAKKAPAKKATAKKAAKKATAKKATAKKATAKKATAKKATAKKTTAKKTAKKAAKKALPKKPALKKAVSKPKPRNKGVTPGGQSGAKPKAAKIEQRTRSKAINAHISSRGKRAQARRDAKGR